MSEENIEMSFLFGNPESQGFFCTIVCFFLVWATFDIKGVQPLPLRITFYFISQLEGFPCNIC